jgi:hypothetical protein
VFSVLTDIPARLVELSDLTHPELFSAKKCLHGRSAAAHFSLMRSFGVVAVYPNIQVGLQAGGRE